MYLIVDVGNTRVKSGVFKDGQLLDHFIFNKTIIISEIKKIVDAYNIKYGIISTVGKLAELELKELQNILNFTELNHQTKVPFVNKYKTPTTLGVDRIALVSAGIIKYPNKNVLIIDAGTCITFDFINKKGEYLGGAISPGIRLRYRSLKDYTAKLPLLETKELDDFIGVDTQTSIHSGVVNGIVNEIDGIIAQYEQKFKDLTIVLTGGDVFFLSKQLKSSIFANQNFLLEGLHTILIYNIEKND